MIEDCRRGTMVDFCEFFSYSSYEVVNEAQFIIPWLTSRPGVPAAGAGAPSARRPHCLEADGEARLRHLDSHRAALQHCPLVRDTHHMSHVCTSFLLQVLCPDHAQHSLLQRSGRGQVREVTRHKIWYYTCFRYWDNFILSTPLTAALNLVAALHNDQFYPVAKLSVKEAKERGFPLLLHALCVEENYFRNSLHI